LSNKEKLEISVHKSIPEIYEMYSQSSSVILTVLQQTVVVFSN